MKCLVRIALLFCLPCAFGQVVSSAAKAGPTAGEFYDAALDLHYRYQVEMRVQNAAAEMASGRLDIFAHPEGKKANSGPDRHCVRPLLVLTLPVDKAPKRDADFKNVYVEKSEEAKKTLRPEKIFAKAVLLEYRSDCVPDEVKSNENGALGSMSVSMTVAPGMLPVAQPLIYQVGTQKLLMSATAGRPLVNGQAAPAPQVRMAMTTRWKGHMLGWWFESNDIAIANMMTKAQVKFGDAPWTVLFPANFGPKD